MIPLKLRLRNFMCYREEQVLDFSGIHLACLAGDNGHGKSALLDAITWALWGKARVRSPDELIALGETEMWVELEFQIGGQRYRVWRQRTLRSRSDLHFYVWNPAAAETGAADPWQPLDEGGVREREAVILHTLHLDYETFTNSSFLQQGKADSFTIKPPGERKEILAKILGLDRYDQYEARAKDEVQQRRERARRSEGELDANGRELARRPEYEAQLQKAQAAVQAAGLEVRAAQAELDGSRQALQRLQEQARQLGDLQQRTARARRELAETSTQLAAAAGRRDAFEVVLAERTAIEAGWARLQEAQRADAEFNRRLGLQAGVQAEMSRLQVAIGQARAGLEAEDRALAGRRQELERRVAGGRQQALILPQVQQVVARLLEQQSRREVVTAELREAADRSGALRAENERLKRDGQGVKQRITLLEDASADCPLCGQPLDAAHRQDVSATLQAELEAIADHYRSNQAGAGALDKQKTALEKEDQRLVQELRERDARQRQAAQIETAIADGVAAEGELLRLDGQIEQLRARLTSAAYAQEEQAGLALLQARLAEIAYDGPAHQALKGELARLEPAGERYSRQLLPALDGIEAARAQVELFAAQQERRRQELAADEAQAQALAAGLEELPLWQHKSTQAAAGLERAQTASDRARREEGAAHQQLSVLAALAERQDRLRTDLQALEAEISLYGELRDAFGKRGLPAMIIESAIPEVETEANRLLGRMSEGRMSLRLETQRTLVSGALAETLEIIISDELGARSYDLYSGGEAFRANLALRIAISQLLARRSGAQLQTLVIDEGFGTQDAQGRALLVEAINSIQHDFERILVVTHIEELKDMFPARIDVVKTAAGSRVTVA